MVQDAGHKRKHRTLSRQCLVWCLESAQSGIDEAYTKMRLQINIQYALLEGASMTLLQALQVGTCVAERRGGG